MNPAAPEWAALGAAALVVLVPTWRWLRIYVTAVHEIGHAVVALAVGGTVHRLVLRPDTSGTAHFALTGGLRGLRRMAVSLAGYPAPGAAGLLGAWLVDRGSLTAWLTGVAVVFGAVVVLWMRNPFGLAALLVAVGGTVYALREADAVVVEVLAHGLAWFLVLGGLRAAFEQWSHGRGPGHAPTDAGAIAAVTRLPWWLWSAGFVAGSGAVVWFAHRWLEPLAWLQG